MKKILLAILSIVTLTANANPTVFDTQTWGDVVTNVKIDDEWRGFLEVNPIVTNNSSNLRNIVIRPAIGYAWTPKITTFLGYTLQANELGLTNSYGMEQDIYQEFLLKDKTQTDINWSLRQRIVERFIPGNNDVSYLWRGRVKGEYALPFYKPLSIIASDEVFANLNSISNNNTIQTGVAQNRALVGVGYRFNRHAQVEIDYMKLDSKGYGNANNITADVFQFAANLDF